MRFHLRLMLLPLIILPWIGCKTMTSTAGPPPAPGRVATTLPASAPTTTYKLKKVTEVEGISEYRLKNGLRVLLFPDPSKPTITVAITYLVGSRHEGYGETGMAHLLEHMLFKGSSRHRDIPKELTAHGARPNGTTWVDRTNYFETFAATDENLRWALDLEADRMVSSFVAQKDLEICEKALMDFLATKKNAFPRFFFLSVDDLLDILSNGDKPQKINQAGHVAKIFQAAEMFKMKEYDDHNQMPDVIGIIACVGKEIFDFHDPLPLKGKVEIYMQFIIDHIIE